MKVCIGIPVLDTMKGRAVAAIMSQAASVGSIADKVVIPAVVGISPHDRAREVVIKTALEHQCDYLYFIDADMLPPPDAFKLLLDSLVSEKAVVSVGHAYRRGYPFTGLWFKVREGRFWHCTAKENIGIYEIDGSGLACNLVDLKWVERNIEPPYFFMGRVEGVKGFVWEDAWFFNKIAEGRGKVVGDSRVRCGHLGLEVEVNDRTAEGLRREAIELDPRLLTEPVGEDSRVDPELEREVVDETSVS